MTGQEFNPKRMFVGSFIPNWLLRRKDVGNSEKIVYSRLMQYCDDEGKAWPSIEELSEETGISERQCRRVLSELEEIGLIKSHQRGLKLTNVYTFLWHPMIEEEPGFRSGQDVRSGAVKNGQSGADENVRSGAVRNGQSLSKDGQVQLTSTSDKEESAGEPDLSVQDSPDRIPHPRGWEPPALELVVEYGTSPAVRKSAEWSEFYWNSMTAVGWYDGTGNRPISHWKAHMNKLAASGWGPDKKLGHLAPADMASLAEQAIKERRIV